MINYRYTVVDREGKTLEIRRGPVSDHGEVVLGLPLGAKFLQISWEVDDGYHSNSELESNQT